jgi:hypothetical protein
MNEPQILKDYKISNETQIIKKNPKIIKEAQIMNEPKNLNDHQISNRTQITNDPKF